MPWWGWFVVAHVGVMATTTILWARFLQTKSSSVVLPGLVLWRDGSSPFTFIVDESFITPRVAAALSEAIAFWNQSIPGLFVPLGEVGEGVIVPVSPCWKLARWEASGSCCTFGYTRLTTRDAKIWSAAIYIDQSDIDELTNLELWRAMAHELGHVLGLAHDESKLSVMHPGLRNRVPMIAIDDAAFVRQRYRPMMN